MPATRGNYAISPRRSLDRLLRDVQAALRSQSQPRRTATHTWHDTFDARLYEAGFALASQPTADGCELSLIERKSDAVVMRATTEQLPEFAWDLPAGPLAERLTPILEMRALTPLGSTRTKTDSLRVLGRADKTVATVAIEETSRKGRPASVLRRLRVRPVRGYEDRAARIAKALKDISGLEPVKGSATDELLQTSGWYDDGYSAKIDVRLHPDQPAGEAFASLLLRLLEIITANVDGARAGVDSEFVHDLRVAVRRSRSALKLAADVLPDDRAHFAKELKWLGDVTTPVRDADVHLLDFPNMQSWLGAGSTEASQPLRALLVRHRRVEQQRLARTLGSKRFTNLLSRWRDWLEALPEQASDARLTQPIGAVADRQIRRRHRVVLKLGAAITPASPDEDLHTLRKRCKELRYALELFASLYPRPVLNRLISELKLLQDNLGAFQDSAVQRDALTRFATELSSANTAAIIAIGRIVAHLEAEQARAREEFGERFRRFAQPGNVRRVKKLVGGSR